MIRFLVLCVVSVIAGSSAIAQATQNTEENAVYALKIRGITVGLINLTSTIDSNAYMVSGVIQSTGLARAIRRFSYRGAARGAVRNGSLWPDLYTETADTGRRNTEAVIKYTNGVPELLAYKSPREAGADSPAPATQGGTIDPLTAIFSLLRDVPRARACTLDVTIFDGKRRSRILVKPLATAAGLPTCSGRYERLQGFTAKEIARHTKFEFTVIYADAGNDMLSVQRIEFDSSYGTATLDRR